MHPTVAALLPRLRQLLPDARIVYGGVFPTYHWRDVLADCPEVDVVVRGEGEETARRLVRALAADAPLEAIPGLAFRRHGEPRTTPPAPMIQRLDDYRVGWELIDHRLYGYYGGKRGVVVQFSRGCPHLCSFCGQRGFWTRWRHRDPVAFAREIARLHREQGVELVSFADENPTTSRKAWQAFLEALIAERCKLTMIATVRADDIVRDADILHLYRQAGFERFLLGMERTDEPTLERIRKGGTTATDRQAIQLLRRHGILSLMSYVIGFEEETERDYWRAFRQILAYDPDQIVTLYVTPHRWTPLYRELQDKRVIQTDRRRWDYKHQVIENRSIPAWRTFFAIKLLEAAVQTRPRALRRTYLNSDPAQSHGMRWYARMGRRVWLHEIRAFLFRDRRIADGPTLAEHWGEPQDAEEEAMTRRRPKHVSARAAVVARRREPGPHAAEKEAIGTE